MAGGSGSRGKANRGRGSGKRISSPPPPTKRGAVSDAFKDLVDAASDLIELIPFDHYIGNYKGLIPKLREILVTFDPEKSTSLMSEYFGVVLSKDSSQVKRLIVYLRKLDAYFLAFHRKKMYEFGIEDSVPKPERIFKRSTFLGFKESYTETILNSLVIGYYAFRKAVDEIVNEQQEDPPKEVIFGWRVNLVIIMVMLCEAARFHPVFDKTLDLWKRKADERLPKALSLFMQNWSHMGCVARSELPDNGYKPPDVLDLSDVRQATLLLNSKLGALKFIAFHHRGKKSQKDGEGTSRVVNSIYYQQRQEQYPIPPERDMGEVRCGQSHPYPRVKGLLPKRPPARVCDPERKALIGSCWSATAGLLIHVCVILNGRR